MTKKNPPVSVVCTYDNPNTFSRECWQDGRLIYALSEEVFFLTKWPLRPRDFFFGAAIGPWKDGQVVGDPAAIAIDQRPRIPTEIPPTPTDSNRSEASR